MVESDFTAECWVGPSRAVLRFSPNSKRGVRPQPHPSNQEEVYAPVAPVQVHPAITNGLSATAPAQVTYPASDHPRLSVSVVQPTLVPEASDPNPADAPELFDSGPERATSPQCPPFGLGGPNGWLGERNMLRQQLKVSRKAVKSKTALAREHAEEAKRLRRALAEDGRHHAGRIRADSNGETASPEKLQGELRKLRKELDMDRRSLRELQNDFKEEQSLRVELQARNKILIEENRSVSKEVAALKDRFARNAGNTVLQQQVKDQAKMIAKLQEQLRKASEVTSVTKPKPAEPEPPSKGSPSTPPDDEYEEDFEIPEGSDASEDAAKAEQSVVNRINTEATDPEVVPAIGTVVEEDEAKNTPRQLTPRSLFDKYHAPHIRAPARRHTLSFQKAISHNIDNEPVSPGGRPVSATTRVLPGDVMCLQRSLSLQDLTSV